MQNLKLPIYLRDYNSPAYLIDSVNLIFNLDENQTIVQSKLKLRRIREESLVLDGQNLILRQLILNERVLTPDEYKINDKSLIIHQTPELFNLEITTEICPSINTALKGLYASTGSLCTQCEPEGFREITYYIDCPDVMATFTTKLIADPQRYPVLLSNGNPAESGELPDGRHYATWIDPIPKPSYLFALVAGDLVWVSDTYLTNNNHKVELRVYVQRHNQDQCAHALASIKKAMKWDELVYGREYDLKVYQIVAVDYFNMGAMENKGLNIFNSRYVLARPETATDDDFESIESVIAHEYFHNWSGNRVTCRDWFQLSLKEGFTVFRDQQFTADMTSPTVKRIKEVQLLRTAQFREDSGPLAHPVRPDSYIEINNFYTVTIYEKGAELVRMVYHLLGAEIFRRGTDLYFSRHDGQAVTTDDFLYALENASGQDLTQFRRWYTQAGTPLLTCHGKYDPVAATYTLTIKQSCPPTPHQPTKEPLHLPFAIGLLDSNGEDLPLQLSNESLVSSNKTRVLELRAENETFTFTNINVAPLPSLLRRFSAPVKVLFDYTDNDLAFLMVNDNDLFNRWDAGQQLATQIIKRLITDYDNNRPLIAPPLFVEAMNAIIQKALSSTNNDKRLLAEALTLPSESYIAEQIDPINPLSIHQVRIFLRTTIAQTLREQLLQLYQLNLQNILDNQSDSIAIGNRRLKNVCLGYLMEITDDSIINLCMQQFQSANNMTDAIAALSFLANTDCQQRIIALDQFYHKWRHHSLVLDKWFSLQVTSRLPDTLKNVNNLLHHTAFNITNPNKVRAVIGAFCHANPVHFHDISGSGYNFLAEQITIIDTLNPQIASRLISALSNWRCYEPQRRNYMQMILEKIINLNNLSKDVYEIVSKSLN